MIDRFFLLATLIVARCVLADTASPGHIERIDPRIDELISVDAAIEIAAQDIHWAEGPLWDRQNDSLLFSDVPRNGVYRWVPGKPVELFVSRSGYSGRTAFSGQEPGSNGLTFDREGRLVMAQHGDRGIARRERDGRLIVLVSRYQGRRLNSPNDLVYGSNGDLYFTDPPFGLAGTFDDPVREIAFQGIYRLRRNGTLQALVTDLDAPNGIAFSPDERTLYVSNATEARPVWMAYPVDTDGSLGEGRQFAEARAYVTPRSGLPDGLKSDRFGNLFAAGPGGVHIFAADGTRIGRIVTGVPTGNVAWGEDGSVLYIAANHRILRLQTMTSGELP